MHANSHPQKKRRGEPRTPVPTGAIPSEPSKLQRKLVSQIAQYIRDHGLREGDHLTELGLAEALNVSRTPVRGALERLAGLGVVEAGGPRRGFQVTGSPDALIELTDTPARSDEEEDLYLKVAGDYLAGRLPDQFSEADMTRQYGASRGVLQRVLQRMLAERVVERNPGYGWRFAPLLRSVEAHDASYRFRLLIEPAAQLEPTFQLDRAWAARTRKEHEAILAMPRSDLSSVRFFEVNAEFHAGLAACSGNPFIHEAVQAQNQLRRFLSYRLDRQGARIEESCREHMAILSALERDEREWGAALMRRHLELAGQTAPAV